MIPFTSFWKPINNIADMAAIFERESINNKEQTYKISSLRSWQYRSVKHLHEYL